MVLHFSELKAHKKHVTGLYRHALRSIRYSLAVSTHPNISINLDKNVDKLDRGFAKQLLASTKSTTKKNAKNKSSWSVYKLLQQLTELNKLLENNDPDKITNLKQFYENRHSRFVSKREGVNPTLNDVTIINNELDNLVKTLHPLKYNKNKNLSNIQTPEHIRRMGILSRYLKRHKLNLAPENKERLLPLALQEYGTFKLNILKRKFECGPPKTYLNYTKAGSFKIWFVRSAINKKRHQSKKLTYIINKEKVNAQDRLDQIRYCESLKKWAFFEGLWEHSLDSNNSILNFNKFTTGKDHIINWNKLKHENNSFLNSWLQPIDESIHLLERQNKLQSNFFNNYYEKILLPKGGQFDYYQNKSLAYFNHRKKIFDKMNSIDLPKTNAFIPELNLYNILKKYRF